MWVKVVRCLCYVENFWYIFGNFLKCVWKVYDGNYWIWKNDKKFMKLLLVIVIVFVFNLFYDIMGIGVVLRRGKNEIDGKIFRWEWLVNFDI